MRDLMRLVEAMSNPQAESSFRAWFGASAVVDTNGSPLVVYHGSNAHAYSRGRISHFQTGGERGAAFFSSNKQLAHEYGERIYAVYLRIEKPLIVKGDGQHWTGIKPTSKIGGKVTDALRAHHRKKADDLTALFGDPDLRELIGDDPNSAAASFSSKIPDHAETLDDFSLDLITGGDKMSTDDVVKAAKRFGYDGVIFHQVRDSPTNDGAYRHSASDIYAVFHAGQVKSATENSGEFSRDDFDIQQ